ncbi:ferredoxin [Jiangella rhizosphaerae]|uniref:Ferredoxin n=1 Tax=Jiangella rhizosphaerae TaxID=2293569 RepID=A0A418KIZ1_9ACTN|nr:ferredoxin [Jiangella rhizosphaerae]RIQ13215.1 ferredoxin [Jiangella rhizosphaerae]
MKITVEIDRCVGGGQCVMAAPDVFDQDDDGLAVLLDPDPPAGLADDVQLAARLCPARAIVVEA